MSSILHYSLLQFIVFSKQFRYIYPSTSGVLNSKIIQYFKLNMEVPKTYIFSYTLPKHSCMRSTDENKSVWNVRREQKATLTSEGLRSGFHIRLWRCDKVGEVRLHPARNSRSGIGIASINHTARRWPNSCLSTQTGLLWIPTVSAGMRCLRASEMRSDIFLSLYRLLPHLYVSIDWLRALRKAVMAAGILHSVHLHILHTRLPNTHFPPCPVVSRFSPYRSRHLTKKKHIWKRHAALIEHLRLNTLVYTHLQFSLKHQ